jgi:hypothetical protein
MTAFFLTVLSDALAAAVAALAVFAVRQLLTATTGQRSTATGSPVG